MDVAQMMAHCSAAFDMASGRLNLPRIFLGRLIGPFLRPVYTNDKPLSRNSSTDKKLVISDPRDFNREQEQLKLRIQQFLQGGEAQCTSHPLLSLGRLHSKRGPEGCTNTSTITSANSVFEGYAVATTAMANDQRLTTSDQRLFFS
jgi:hypothetical protein